MLTCFCSIESEIPGTPHREPLTAADDAEARREAESLLLQHSSGVAAHVLLGDMLIATIRKPQGPRR